MNTLTYFLETAERFKGYLAGTSYDPQSGVLTVHVLKSRKEVLQPSNAVEAMWDADRVTSTKAELDSVNGVRNLMYRVSNKVLENTGKLIHV